MEAYLKKVKLRLGLSGMLVVVGLAILAMVMLQEKNGILSMETYFSGFYRGTAGGLTLAGIISMVRNIQLLKDEEKRKRRMMLENDERNIYLYHRSMMITGYVMIAGLYVGIYISSFYSHLVSQTLLFILGTYLFIFLIVYTVVRKRH